MNNTEAPFSTDHDLLIGLSTEMKGLRGDVKEIKDGTKTQLADIFGRLEVLEQDTATLRGWRTAIVAVGSSVFAVVCGLVTYIYITNTQNTSSTLQDLQAQLTEHIKETTNIVNKP